MADHYEVLVIDGHPVKVQQHGSYTFVAQCQCGARATKGTLVWAEREIKRQHAESEVVSASS